MEAAKIPLKRQTPQEPLSDGPSARNPFVDTLARVTQYTIVRAMALFLTVAITVYLTILIANMGGYVDEIMKGLIDQAISGRVMGGWLQEVPTQEKFEIIEQTRQAMYEAQGLNEPFLLRTLHWLGRGLALDWGKSKGSLYIRTLGGGGYSGDVKDVILDHLPRTLLVFGSANVLLFVSTVFLALALARRHAGWLDRAVIALSPMGAAPAWAYGIILQVIFLRVLTNLVSGGPFDAWPSEFSLAYLPLMLKHLFLPFLSIFFSGFFTSLYVWRSYFVLYSSEDHVEMAVARGLSSRMIERRHILRPGLPAVLTSFSLMLVVLWQEVIALETFFKVAGIGRVFYAALRSFDIAMILGLVVTFAYLLAITLFVLEIIYSIVDPRVRVGGEGRTARPSRSRKPRARRPRIRLPRRPLPEPRRLTWKASNPHAGPQHPALDKPRPIWWRILEFLQRKKPDLRDMFLDLSRYPSAVIGQAIIVALIAASITTVFILPYDEAVALWRSEENIWYQNPKRALPEWINLFRGNDLPTTIALNSRDGGRGEAGSVSKGIEQSSENMTEILLLFSFDFPYGAPPQELALYVDAQFDEKRPLIDLNWRTPDGREIEITSFSTRRSQTYYLSQDSGFQRSMDGQDPLEALFADPAAGAPVPLQGTYKLSVSGLVFEDGADLDAELVLHGRVHGLAGTDHKRRDLMVSLLWGMPVALSFGILAAVGTSVSTIIIAGLGAWYGGWVDGLIQRITEVNLVLPFLPVSIMVYILYSKSFWAILGVTVLLSIFGSAIKNYRAVFLQIKQAPYIEAAQAYGAGNRRIILRYLIPRILPIMIPQLVILVPSYVFLEATLAFLEVSDPVLPTWGKLIVDALSYGTHSGDWYLILEPAALLMLTGFAFAMVGFALERIFEPRLRER
jgi:peptide/nickel transport system permease protein